MDQRIDRQMARTFKRPVAQGRWRPRQTALFAAGIGVLGMAILLIWINALTAWLTFASLLGYAVVYTMFLKRATPQNIVIGGLAGAAPPLLGWTAVTGEVQGHGLLLALIILPGLHRTSGRWRYHRREEYAAVDIPMLPVTHGVAFTKLYPALHRDHDPDHAVTLRDAYERPALPAGRSGTGRRVPLLGD